MNNPLGQLKKVEDLRTIWSAEDSDFTPWLAQEENLKILSESIGIELELEATEKNVGKFRADIVCKNLDDSENSWVLIENQLEASDHKHLGQLLTYATNLETVTIIWIAAKFNEEHRATLDWLNNITDENFNFFGIKIELWQIDESKYAPHFNIVAKPNDWIKNIAKERRDLDSKINNSPAGQLNLEYWYCFCDFLKEHNSFLNPQTPRPTWLVFSIGRSKFHMSSHINIKNKYIFIVLVIHDISKSFFDGLAQEKTAIENELGEALNWRRMEGKKEGKIVLSLEQADPENRSDWDRQHQWLQNYVEKFDKIFRNRIQNLDANENDDDEINL